MPTNSEENQAGKAIHGIPVSSELANQIEEALEMVRRVQRVRLAERNEKPLANPRTTYVKPKRLVYKVSKMTKPSRGGAGSHDNYGNTYVLPEPVYYPASEG